MATKSALREQLEAAVLERHCADHPLTKKWAAAARRRPLFFAHSTSFPATVRMKFTPITLNVESARPKPDFAGRFFHTY